VRPPQAPRGHSDQPDRVCAPRCDGPSLSPLIAPLTFPRARDRLRSFRSYIPSASNQRPDRPRRSHMNNVNPQQPRDGQRRPAHKGVKQQHATGSPCIPARAGIFEPARPVSPCADSRIAGGGEATVLVCRRSGSRGREFRFPWPRHRSRTNSGREPKRPEPSACVDAEQLPTACFEHLLARLRLAPPSSPGCAWSPFRSRQSGRPGPGSDRHRHAHFRPREGRVRM
jgi:hypothetical protein